MTRRLASFFGGLSDHVADQLAPALAGAVAKIGDDDTDTDGDPDGDPDADADDDAETDRDEERRRQAAEAAAVLLATIGLGDWSPAEIALGEELAPVYGDGVWHGLGDVADEAGIAPATEAGAEARFGSTFASIGGEAVEWARAHAAEAVVGLEARTRGMLNATIVQAIEEGWGPQRLARELRDSFGFGRDRAETIARTEIVDANNAGNFEAYRKTGIVAMKTWRTAGDELVESICRGNAAAGPIPLEAPFPSGDLRPGAHPRCRCVLQAVLTAPAAG